MDSTYTRTMNPVMNHTTAIVVTAFSAIFLALCILYIFVMIQLYRLLTGPKADDRPLISKCPIPDPLWEKLKKTDRLYWAINSCMKEVVPKATGPRTAMFVPAENDPRRVGDRKDYIILMDKDIKKDLFLGYGRYDADKKRPKGKELGDKIAANEIRYLTKGPPVLPNSDYDCVVVDGFHSYLLNIFVIESKEYDEMAKFMSPKYPRRFSDYEYLFFTCSFLDPAKSWNRSLISYYQERLKLKETQLKEKFIDWLNSDETTELETLCYFYSVYRKYVDTFELEARHIQRLPVQGLILLLMRPDLTEEMTLKILFFLKVTLFGLLRDPDKCLAKWVESGLVSYPINCLLKLKAEHEFTRISNEDIIKLGNMFGDMPLTHEDDWEYEN